MIDRLRTPSAVQAYLNALPYNTERGGETLRSFRGVVRTGTAHCLEAALFAAVVLEQHGYPPLVLSFESVDLLDHVIFVYRQRGRWGSIARSRDPGLHGRKPRVRDAARAGAQLRRPVRGLHREVRGYAVVDMRALGTYDWRLAERQRLEGRAPAARLSASADQDGTRPHRRGSARGICASAPTIRTVKPVYYPRPRTLDVHCRGEFQAAKPIRNAARTRAASARMPVNPGRSRASAS